MLLYCLQEVLRYEFVYRFGNWSSRPFSSEDAAEDHYLTSFPQLSSSLSEVTFPPLSATAATVISLFAYATDSRGSRNITAKPAVITVYPVGFADTGDASAVLAAVESYVDTKLASFAVDQRVASVVSTTDSAAATVASMFAITGANASIISTCSEWSAWSSCTGNCIGASKSRVRSCPNDANGVESKACTPDGCFSNGWADWSEWSECSTSCSGLAVGYNPGTRTRQRACLVAECTGASSDTVACNTELVSLLRWGHL